MIKIIITGHSNGIGKQIFKNLNNQKNIQIIGISRSNGYDLSNDYYKVLNFIDQYNPDIFINNAYVPNYQRMLLQKLIIKWVKLQKMIINIGSVASLTPLNNPDYFNQYAINKRQQKQICDDYNYDFSKKNFLENKCKVVNLNFDYVDTNFKSKYNKYDFPLLEVKDVSDMVEFVIKSFKSHVCIREITFHSNKLKNQEKVND